MNDARISSHRMTSEAELLAFGERFASQQIPRAEWTHAAHFAAAIYLIAMRGDLDAERDMPALIRALNEAQGVTNSATQGYHHTITLASLGATRACLAERAAAGPIACLDMLLAGPCGRGSWLLDYWTPARLFSTEARSRWVGPDIAPLPFAVRLNAQTP